MYRDNGHMDTAWGVAMMIGVWVLIALAVLWFAYSLRTNNQTALSQSPVKNTARAEGILAERLAHGEIDQAEYESTLATLTR